jgi:murein L,D-transpeptidase YcbB/YkuD
MLRILAVLFAAVCIPSTAFARLDKPIEPVELPPSIQQGVDLIYIDPEIAPELRERDRLLAEIGLDDSPGAAIDLLVPVHPTFTELRRGLMLYRAKWSGLPQHSVPPGPTLKPGDKGERVALLRSRLGLGAGDLYDPNLAKAVRRYQQAHGLKADGIAGAATVESLNLGAAHYERLVQINLERARRLPGSAEKGRYIVVDAGAARIHMYEDGKLKDSMRAIVGKPASATPMMAAKIRYASVNPYWNVPHDLVQNLIAPKVLAQGVTHIESERYQLLSGWTGDAQILDPAAIDWQSVAQGQVDFRVRQLPGHGNSMGDIKFMMPNDFGIYLHDTPNKALFESEDRWISNGCVRVEDAHRLAQWLFGHMPKGRDPNAEEDVPLENPVPVYITYLTVGTTADGLVFRNDPYSRDTMLLAHRLASRSAASSSLR